MGQRRTHGVQFRADFLRSAPPTTAEGIEKYLASGMIKGIGPIYAKKLARAFSEAVFDVIEQKPERLQEVDGIGPKRAESTVASWDQKAIREIMIFLQSEMSKTATAPPRQFAQKRRNTSPAPFRKGFHRYAEFHC